ncbi:XPG domain containing-domain-containing protein [Gaertneriomyces semiglobifer]|nr:XPG domain containing-domain-containing protein [Gaertneriomyces semiglobifer]
MGVSGLASYVEHLQPRPAVSIRWPTTATNDQSQLFAIDGNAYVHYVAKKISWLQGASHGQLAAVFEHGIQEFINAGMSLQFVFDGPLPPAKIDQRIARDSEKIARISTVITSTVLSPSLSVNAATLLPPLAIPMSIHRLHCMKISVCVPQEEADVVLARIARLHSAAIISKDSDFYVHKLENPHTMDHNANHGRPSICGYIPLESVRVSDGYMEGELYTSSAVAGALGVHHTLMPALAALAGCDYISEQDKSLIKLHLCTTKYKQRARIRNILHTLKTLRDLANEIDSPETQSRLREALEFAVRQYTDVTDEATPVLSTIEKYTNTGQYNPKLVEIATQKTFWCSPFLEDISRVSAWEVSRSMRSWIYALVAWSTQATATCNAWGAIAVDREAWDDFVHGKLYIDEHLRRGERLVAEQVRSATAAQLREKLPCGLAKSDGALPLLHDLSDEHRTTLYLRILDSDTAKVRALSPRVLPMALAVRYLIAQCHARGQPIANHELSAMICAGILSLYKPNTPLPPAVEPAQPVLAPRHETARACIHRLAQLETILLCALLLAQSMLHPAVVSETTLPAPHDAISAYWECLDGPEFHRCMKMAKGGATGERLLQTSGYTDIISAKELFADYQQLYEAIMEGNECYVDQVMDYSEMRRPGSGAGCVKKKKKKVVKDSPHRRATSSNLFDVLSTGCNF